MKKKIMALCLVAILAITAIGGATLAYFTDTSETAINTFTVGEIKIELDEAKVDPDTGKAVDPEVRVLENTYDDIHPGMTVDKDPTVTVKADSENCYVRMTVTVDTAALALAFPVQSFPELWTADGVFLLQNLVGGWDNTVWVPQNDADAIAAMKTGKYEFWYKDIVAESQTDTELPALFETITFPGKMTNAQIAYLEGFKVNVVADAIQSAEFADAAAAWATWGK